jgi:hypothetical protein
VNGRIKKGGTACRLTLVSAIVADAQQVASLQRLITGILEILFPWSGILDQP